MQPQSMVVLYMLHPFPPRGVHRARLIDNNICSIPFPTRGAGVQAWQSCWRRTRRSCGAWCAPAPTCWHETTPFSGAARRLCGKYLGGSTTLGLVRTCPNLLARDHAILGCGLVAVWERGRRLCGKDERAGGQHHTAAQAAAWLVAPPPPATHSLPHLLPFTAVPAVEASASALGGRMAGVTLLLPLYITVHCCSSLPLKHTHTLHRSRPPPSTPHIDSTCHTPSI